MRGSVRTLSTAFAITMAAVALAGGTAQAGKFKVLHSFCGGQHRFCGDGSNPQGGLVMDAAGNVYGTAARGGKLLEGTVFELERKPSGGFNFKTIYRFCKSGFCGQNPNGSLIIDTGGNLYGTADNLVFELSPVLGQKQWSEKILYRFCSQQNCTDGSLPEGGLTYGGASSGAPYDGVSPLFGTTSQGGANNRGTAFELTNSGGHWTEAVLYNFCSQGGSDCTDGNSPQEGLAMDASGNLYGVTVQGGGNDPHLGGAGVVFELTPSKSGAWSETTLYRFCAMTNCSDGARPLAGLVLDSVGNLYGTTAFGGTQCPTRSDGCGVVFKLIPNGAESQESVLYAFCKKSNCRDGASPAGGVFLDEAGDIFGTTFQGGGNNIDEFGLGGGTVFALNGSTIKVLYRFCALAACADGEYPNASIVMDNTGRMFGVTELGGAFGDSTDGGVVFKLTP